MRNQMTEEEREIMATELARRATSEMDMGDLIDYYEESQFAHYSNLPDDILLEVYEEMEK
jgi:hypothetical protein